MSRDDRHDASHRFFWRVALGGMTVAILGGVASSILLSLWRSRAAVEGPADASSAASAGYARTLSDGGDRMAEIQRIVKMQRRDALPILAQYARRDKDVEFRLACIRAIGGMGDARAAHALAFLADSPDERREIRLAAIAALGAMPAEVPLSHLKAVLTGEDASLRLAAVQAVACRDTAEAVDLLARALKDESQAVRAAAVAALAGKATAEATEQLLHALGSLDPKVRMTAVAALGRRDGPAVHSALSRAASDPDEAVRAEAVRGVRGADAAALDALIAGAGPRAAVSARIEVAQAIRRQGGAKHAAALLRLLDDLGPRRESDAAIQPLRQEVLDGLLAMGVKALEPVLAAALDGECDALAERVAADVCRRAGTPAVAPIVAGILKWKLFPDPDELKLWIEVLGDLGDPAALPALNRALAQDIEGMAAVVEAARAKIEKRSGAPLPPCAPDAGLLVEKADPARRRAPAAPPAFHLPEHPDSQGMPENGVVRVVLAKAIWRAPAPDAEGGKAHAAKRPTLPDVEPEEYPRKPAPAGRDHPASGRPGAGAGAPPEAKPERPGILLDLEIEIRRQGGAWQTDFIGYSPGLNKRNHHGRVVGHARLPSGQERVMIEMFVLDDQYVAGGYGEYALTFPPDRAQFEGQYRGHFNFDPREGPLGGACWNVDGTVSDYPRFAPGEHPRLLCRAFQRDALREKARTDFGRQVLRALRKKLAAEKRMFQQRVDYVTTWTPGMHLAVGHGLLAFLFDDPEHGRRAAALVMERTTTTPYGGEHGERVPGAWITSPFAYDMAYAYLSSAERTKANEFFGGFSDGRLFAPHCGCIGNLAARGVYDVSGLTALSLSGEAGRFRWAEMPAGPEAISLDGEEKPGAERGAPVNAVTPDTLIAQWLIAGPFPARGGAAPIEKPEDLRAEPGMRIPGPEGPREFKPLPPEWVKDTPGCGSKKQAIQVPHASPESLHYLYCELQADGPREGMLDWRHVFASGASRLWLDGREMANGIGVMLKPGRHRMLVAMSGSVVSPCLLGANVRRAVAMGKRHAWEHALWDDARRRHAETGLMTSMDYALQMCRHVYRDHARRLAEETRVSGRYARGSLLFAAAVRMACGEQLFIDTPSAFTAAPQACLPHLSPEELCLGMGMVPPDLQPALAREFDRRFPPGKLGQLDCILLAAALVNYPLHVKPRAPIEGGDRLTVSRKAYHVALFTGDESHIQCQVAIRDEKPRLVGPEVFVPRAGALMLRSQGADWITDGPAPRHARFEAVVDVEKATNTGPCRVLDFQNDTAGAAVLRLDMSPAYRSESGRPIEARRQVAVDYTGRSGADAVIVVLDRLRGGGKKTWVLPTTVASVDYGDKTYIAERVWTDRFEYLIKSQPRPDSSRNPTNEFLLRRGGSGASSRATLRGALLRPSECPIGFVPTATKGPHPVLQAAADADTVEFLVVLTLQQGAPPPVSFQGDAQNGVIEVGKMKVRIAGGEIGRSGE